jgi:hypothetical protein
MSLRRFRGLYYPHHLGDESSPSRRNVTGQSSGRHSKTTQKFHQASQLGNVQEGKVTDPNSVPDKPAGTSKRVLRVDKVGGNT